MQNKNQITLINPPKSVFRLNFGEVWEYRDLIYLLVRRDYVAQYKQTVLGPAWHVIQPLLTTIIFTIVFGKIAKIPTDGIPPFLFYMAGTILWSYFSAVLNSTANTFIANKAIFGKVYFPRLVMPVATTISKMIGLSIQFTFFGICVIWFAFSKEGLQLHWQLILVPALIGLLATYALALGVLVAALTTRYRDLVIAMTFGVQLYLYLTPIVYPISSLPEQWQIIAMANPLAPIIEAFRFATLGTGRLDYFALLLSMATIAAVLMLGVAMFNRVERTFMDSV